MPAIEPVLEAWGHTSRLIPCDTVVPYGAWNPSGDRITAFHGFNDNQRRYDAFQIAD